MTHRSDTGLAATTLRVTNIPGTTRVKLASPGRRDMAIELSGPEAVLNNISWQVRGGVLHISGTDNAGGNIVVSDSGPGFRSRMTVRGGRGGVVIGGRGGMVVSGGGTVMTSGGGQTVISTGGRGGTVIVDGKVVSGPGAGQDAEAGEAELTVFVPEGTPAQIADDGSGNYELGDLRGTLDLRIEGFSQVRAGALTATRIRIGGSAEIEIASVLDALRADIAGSGRISVLAGEVGQLRLSVSGSGQIGRAHV